MDLTMNHILSTLSSPVKKKKYVLIGLCLDNVHFVSRLHRSLSCLPDLDEGWVGLVRSLVN